MPPDLETKEVFYPDSDGQPLESEIHRDLMHELIGAVKWHFRDRPDLYASGNLFIYYEKGNPRKSIGPDFFAVRGVPKHRRRVYKLWEEGKGPELVVELTSPTTYVEDLETKRERYEQLGVLEYFIFDPLVEPDEPHFEPQMRGYRRRGGRFELEEPRRLEGGSLSLHSEVLGLDLVGRDDRVGWVDPSSGEPLLVPQKAVEALEEEKRRARAERRRARAEKRRAAAERRKAEEAQYQAEEAQRKAEEARREAAALRLEAEAEKRRADAAEAELARLRAELERREG
jgi:Uma2 family endonuclease